MIAATCDKPVIAKPNSVNAIITLPARSLTPVRASLTWGVPSNPTATGMRGVHDSRRPHRSNLLSSFVLLAFHLLFSRYCRSGIADFAVNQGGYWLVILAPVRRRLPIKARRHLNTHTVTARATSSRSVRPITRRNNGRCTSSDHPDFRAGSACT